MKRQVFLALLFAPAIAGCFGNVDGDGGVGAGGVGAGGVGAGGSGGGAVGGSGALDVGATPLTRLTAREVANSVRFLLPGATVQASDLPPDSTAGGFETNALFPVSDEVVRIYRDLFEQVAATVDPARILPCTPSGAADTACATQFIRTVGRRLWRRPLQADEVTRLARVFDVGRMDPSGFTGGVGLVLQALLSSPHFLYRVEVGTPGPAPEIVRLTSHELAARLSYFFWDTTPDPTLDTAADAGDLALPDKLAAQAARLLDDERADVPLRLFFHQWLTIDQVRTAQRDTTLYPAFNPALAADMVREVDDFALDVLRKGDRKLGTLLTARYSIVSPALASAVYGITLPAGPARRIDFPDQTRRAGLLTNAAILTATAHGHAGSPTLRGLRVKESFLCQPMPPPDPTVDVTPPAVSATLSTRDRYAMRYHTVEPCRSCHRQMDEIGFAFGNYDSIGRFVTMDAGQTVNARADIIGTGDLDGPVTGAVELAGKLAGSPTVSRCFAGQWARYALARPTDDMRDDGWLTTVTQRFSEAGLDTRALLLALVASDSFKLRRVPSVGP